MLAALLLAGIVAAPLGSAGLFVGARQRAQVTGPWPATRRLVLALAGLALLGLGGIIGALTKATQLTATPTP